MSDSGRDKKVSAEQPRRRKTHVGFEVPQSTPLASSVNLPPHRPSRATAPHGFNIDIAEQKDIVIQSAGGEIRITPADMELLNQRYLPSTVSESAQRATIERECGNVERGLDMLTRVIATTTDSYKTIHQGELERKEAKDKVKTSAVQAGAGLLPFVGGLATGVQSGADAMLKLLIAGAPLEATAVGKAAQNFIRDVREEYNQRSFYLGEAQKHMKEIIFQKLKINETLAQLMEQHREKAKEPITKEEVLAACADLPRSDKISSHNILDVLKDRIIHLRQKRFDQELKAEYEAAVSPELRIDVASCATTSADGVHKRTEYQNFLFRGFSTFYLLRDFFRPLPDEEFEQFIPSIPETIFTAEKDEKTGEYKQLFTYKDKKFEQFISTTVISPFQKEAEEKGRVALHHPRDPVGSIAYYPEFLQLKSSEMKWDEKANMYRRVWVATPGCANAQVILRLLRTTPEDRFFIDVIKRLAGYDKPRVGQDIYRRDMFTADPDMESIHRDLGIQRDKTPEEKAKAKEKAQEEESEDEDEKEAKREEDSDQIGTEEHGNVLNTKDKMRDLWRAQALVYQIFDDNGAYCPLLKKPSDLSKAILQICEIDSHFQFAANYTDKDGDLENTFKSPSPLYILLNVRGYAEMLEKKEVIENLERNLTVDFIMNRCIYNPNLKTKADADRMNYTLDNIVLVLKRLGLADTAKRVERIGRDYITTQKCEAEKRELKADLSDRHPLSGITARSKQQRIAELDAELATRDETKFEFPLTPIVLSDGDRGSSSLPEKKGDLSPTSRRPEVPLSRIERSKTQSALLRSTTQSALNIERHDRPASRLRSSLHIDTSHQQQPLSPNIPGRMPSSPISGSPMPDVSQAGAGSHDQKSPLLSSTQRGSLAHSSRSKRDSGVGPEHGKLAQMGSSLLVVSRGLGSPVERFGSGTEGGPLTVTASRTGRQTIGNPLVLSADQILNASRTRSQPRTQPFVLPTGFADAVRPVKTPTQSQEAEHPSLPGQTNI